MSGDIAGSPPGGLGLLRTTSSRDGTSGRWIEPSGCVVIALATGRRLEDRQRGRGAWQRSTILREPKRESQAGCPLSLRPALRGRVCELEFGDRQRKVIDGD